ncbi:putative small integral membrane protein [Bradyrhizobium sp. USDA 4512]
MPSQVAIGLPVDLSFTTLSQLVEAQLKGKTFPEDGSGPVDVTVKSASIAASGDRLLISLLVHAKEKASWFGLGAEATVHIWGRPRLDQPSQTLRLTDVELAVESEAAFGLLGAAARAAIPHMQQTLNDRLVVDLKPFATNAQRKVAAAIADLQKNEEGIRVDAEVNSIRLAGIDFDSKTLRVIVETDGTIKAAVTALPAL